jgi:8-oxo-dGTP diphosphatase
VRAAVASIAPWDEREALDRRDALAWVDSGAPIWRTERPATPPEHLVVYCVLVDVAARALLLVDHHNAGLWVPTGGHVEPAEAPVVAAERELGEELGVTAPRLGRLPLFVSRTETVGLDQGHVDVTLWYGFRGTPDLDFRPDPVEFADHRWWTFAEITPGARIEPELVRFVAKLGRVLDAAREQAHG